MSESSNSAFYGTFTSQLFRAIIAADLFSTFFVTNCTNVDASLPILSFKVLGTHFEMHYYILLCGEDDHFSRRPHHLDERLQTSTHMLQVSLEKRNRPV